MNLCCNFCTCVVLRKPDGGGVLVADVTVVWCGDRGGDDLVVVEALASAQTDFGCKFFLQLIFTRPLEPETEVSPINQYE